MKNYPDNCDNWNNRGLESGENDDVPEWSKTFWEPAFQAFSENWKNVMTRWHQNYGHLFDQKKAPENIYNEESFENVSSVENLKETRKFQQRRKFALCSLLIVIVLIVALCIVSGLLIKAEVEQSNSAANNAFLHKNHNKQPSVTMQTYSDVYLSLNGNSYPDSTSSSMTAVIRLSKKVIDWTSNLPMSSTATYFREDESTKTVMPDDTIHLTGQDFSSYSESVTTAFSVESTTGLSLIPPEVYYTDSSVEHQSQYRTTTFDLQRQSTKREEFFSPERVTYDYGATSVIEFSSSMSAYSDGNGVHLPETSYFLPTSTNELKIPSITYTDTNSRTEQDVSTNPSSMSTASLLESSVWLPLISSRVYSIYSSDEQTSLIYTDTNTRTEQDVSTNPSSVSIASLPESSEWLPLISAGVYSIYSSGEQTSQHSTTGFDIPIQSTRMIEESTLTDTVTNDYATTSGFEFSTSLAAASAGNIPQSPETSTILPTSTYGTEMSSSIHQVIAPANTKSLRIILPLNITANGQAYFSCEADVGDPAASLTWSVTSNDGTEELSVDVGATLEKLTSTELCPNLMRSKFSYKFDQTWDKSKLCCIMVQDSTKASKCTVLDLDDPYSCVGKASGSYIPVRDSCTDYNWCVNGEAIFNSCPGKTYFTESQDLCTYNKNEAYCSTHNKTATNTTRDEGFSCYKKSVTSLIAPSEPLIESSSGEHLFSPGVDTTEFLRAYQIESSITGFKIPETSLVMVDTGMYTSGIPSVLAIKSSVFSSKEFTHSAEISSILPTSLDETPMSSSVYQVVVPANPESLKIIPPLVFSANKQASFSCEADVGEPAASLTWSVTSKDGTQNLDVDVGATLEKLTSTELCPNLMISKFSYKFNQTWDKSKLCCNMIQDNIRESKCTILDLDDPFSCVGKASGAYIPVRDSCTDYTWCVNGEANSYFCPGKTYFTDSQDLCTYNKNEAYCSTHNKTATNTTRDEGFSCNKNTVINLIEPSASLVESSSGKYLFSSGVDTTELSGTFQIESSITEFNIPETSSVMVDTGMYTSGIPSVLAFKSSTVFTSKEFTHSAEISSILPTSLDETQMSSSVYQVIVPANSKSLRIISPLNITANRQVSFSCEADVGEPAASLTWSVMSKDGTEELNVDVGATLERLTSTELCPNLIRSKFSYTFDQTWDKSKLCCNMVQDNTKVSKCTVLDLDDPYSCIGKVTGAHVPVRDSCTDYNWCVNGEANLLSCPGKTYFTESQDLCTYNKGESYCTTHNKTVTDSDGADDFSCYKQSMEASSASSVESSSGSGVHVLSSGVDTIAYSDMLLLKSSITGFKITETSSFIVQLTTSLAIVDTGIYSSDMTSKEATLSAEISSILPTSLDETPTSSSVYQVIVPANFKSLRIIPPLSVTAGRQVSFACEAGVGDPAASLVWSMTSKDGTEELNVDVGATLEALKPTELCPNLMRSKFSYTFDQTWDKSKLCCNMIQDNTKASKCTVLDLDDPYSCVGKPEASYIPVQDSCTWYNWCVNGIAHLQQCQGKTYFTVAQDICTYNKDEAYCSTHNKTVSNIDTDEFNSCIILV
ncbi:hypothetical protein SNE40_001123 [Patella caerulea]|uniref:Chitin-binding type-2 domain-containing protein n=1 Tax=Patella caerulea TaxID=87958 RepID=A0AAN8KDD8_PATCE